MARENFTAATKNTLRLRVSLLCSNPNCRALTSGPHTDPLKATIGGDASHICAASPGGPRFDGSMSKEERVSIENAIWLCKKCARIIDADGERFPVSLLKAWIRG